MHTHLNRRDFIQTSSLLGAATALSALTPNGIAADGPVEVALVGCAHIHTPGFVDLLKGRSDVRVSLAWDHDRARAEKSAKKLGAEVVDHQETIWNNPKIKAVVICSETNRHHDLVLAAARAGKPMFVEKPLGINARESEQMAQAIEKAGLPFTTGYFMRTEPRHLFLKSEIEKGHFGKITRIRGSNCHAGSLKGWFDTEWRWMADPSIAGVGAFGDLGTHKLDILMWMMGEVESVTASIQVVTHRYGDCDESGEGLIKFKNGTIGSLAAGWLDVDDPVQLVISGTEAHAVILNDQLYYKNDKIPGADGKAAWTDLPKGPRAPLHQFIDTILGKGPQPLVPVREAAARVHVMEAMYKAAKKHTWVHVS